MKTPLIFVIYSAFFRYRRLGRPERLRYHPTPQRTPARTTR
ncbi:hypothetical protein C4K13_6168 [Pseudomonas chlororaphis subsp. aureofaciens]|nr:hypothetical protein C4K13_6168 [Pseudomonas chlororaphis subsp. aureofaciens]AZE01830.1 hypothetical protein C4K12_6008 [Pseudomonas chlororaphis subsp. aureofaciens]